MMRAMKLVRLTPVLFVEAVEASLPFWVDRVGFAKTMDAPGPDGALAFVALVRDGLEVMLQTHASVAEDAPPLAADRGPTHLYIEVEDLDALEARLGDAPRVMPRRVAPYGMAELFVREPSGHVVVFAQRAG